jgi:hypothetical protein
MGPFIFSAFSDLSNRLKLSKNAIKSKAGKCLFSRIADKRILTGLDVIIPNLGQVNIERHHAFNQLFLSN